MYFYEPDRKSTVVTTGSGVWSGNTLKISSGLCRQVLIKATTSSTTFDFSITDNLDRRVYNRTDETGELNELLSLPMRGVYTCAIANATNNEAFTVLLGVKEQY